MYKDYTDNLIDTYQLFELAKYCDELVPDGKGGLEPRFSANIYISKTTEAIIFASVRFNINMLNILNNASVVMPIILLYCKLRAV